MTFMLPTDIGTAFRFYEDMQRIVNFLPRIEFIKAFDDKHLRMCYTSKELNAYQIRIYCDVFTKLDPQNYTIHVDPKPHKLPVKPSASFNAASTYGSYSSQSYFYPEGATETRLEYYLTLAAELPKPWALKMMPDTIMNSIAGSITNYRIHEIANGFIEKSLTELPKWMTANGRYP